MLSLLTKSAVRRKIIALFALNPKSELYSRQVALTLDESPHATNLELKHLAVGGLLTTHSSGRQHYYQWNSAYPFAPLLRTAVEKLFEQGDPEIEALPHFEQQERIEANLQRVVEEMKRSYDPEKIILFGSAAEGKIGPYSDIDLVVIKQTSLPFFKRAGQLAELLDYDVDIDFLVYTPAEFSKAIKEKKFFQREIVKKGKVLYDKAA